MTDSYIFKDLYATIGLEKGCYGCVCVPQSVFDRANLVYICDEYDRSSVNQPYEWDHFQCPPISCIDSLSDYWFEDYPNSIECDNLCHCSGSQGKICAKGWSNITSNPTFAHWLSYDCMSGFGTNTGIEGVK